VSDTIQDRRAPRAGDDLFWFHEAKRLAARVVTLEAELHKATGLWYGACAARTEMRMALAEVERENTRLKVERARDTFA